MVRFGRRAIAGDINVPKGFGWAATVVWFGGLLVYGTAAGAGPASLIDRIAYSAGFGVELHIQGNQQTSPIELYSRLGGQSLRSLAGVDLVKAREIVEDLPWVQSAVLKKYFPERLEIEISERRPFAVWQRGDELSVVERSGSPIAPLAPGAFAELPLLVGPGAEKSAAVFLAKIERYPSLASKIGAYVRVAERRWDLHMRNGVKVMLPAEDYERALTDIAELDGVYDLLARDIEAIDFRLPDRIALRLTSDSDERRLAAIEERSKIMKKRLKARGARL
jgi:cell division protein FtsQ